MTDLLKIIPHKHIKYGDKIGGGGFGIVFKGQWEQRQVAIKALYAHNLPGEGEQSLVQEARVMSKLKHKNVVRFYGICKEPGHYAILMGLMPRGDLHTLLNDKDQKLPWTQRWKFAIGIGSGLSYLHANKVLHRDLKSPNILLDHNLNAKITDFGLSKIKATGKTYTYSEGGTPSWMAPELLKKDEKKTKATDMYAFGMVLWEIAARKEPFAEYDANRVMVFIFQGETEDIPKDCPKPYASLIESCWEKKPEERPTAAKALELLQKKDVNLQNIPSNLPRPGLLSRITTTIRSWVPFNRWSSVRKVEFSDQSLEIKISCRKSLGIGKWQCLRIIGQKGVTGALANCSDGILAWAGGCRTIKIRSTKTGKCLRTIQWNWYGSSLQGARWDGFVHALTYLGNDLVACGDDTGVKIWNTQTGVCMHELVFFCTESLANLGNSIIACGYRKGDIAIWNTKTGECLNTLKVNWLSELKITPHLTPWSLADLGSGILAAKYAMDSRYSLMFVPPQLPPKGVIKIWNAKTGECLKTLQGQPYYGRACLAYLGKGLLASARTQISIWDIEHGKCFKTLSGHSKRITSLVHLGGKIIASGSRDGIVKIWNVETGKCIKSLFRDKGWVLSLVILSSDSLAIGYSNGDIEIWRTPKGVVS